MEVSDPSHAMPLYRRDLNQWTAGWVDWAKRCC